MSHEQRNLAPRLRDNVARVWEQIAVACQQAGRPVDAVRLVAVTKYVDTPLAVALAQVLVEHEQASGRGQPVRLGENRPQVLRQRWEQWGDGPDVEWHLIGHLQTNKIKWVAGQVALIHSLDRFELLDRLQDFAAGRGMVCRGLLEFQISGDAGKQGLSAADVGRVVECWARWPNLQLCGVMGMSGLSASSAEAQCQFESLQQIFTDIKRQLPPELRESWAELSMGMSGDLAAAIAAGSTFVRIGSALYSGILPPSPPTP